MAANDTRQLQLQISASAELMIRNLKAADNAVAQFQRQTNGRLASIDAKFAALGNLKAKLGALDANVGLGGIASAATGVTLIALAKRGLDYASSLGEVSQQLGVTTKDLQVYRYAASQVGIEQEEMDRGLAKLTLTLGKAKLGAEEPAEAFGALGISIASLNGKAAGDVIPRIAEGLSKISDPAKRAAIEVQLFGKAGQKLDTLLTGGAKGVAALADEAERLGLVLSDKQIQDADRTADKLSELKQQLEARIAGVVAENAGAIYNLANALATLTGKVIGFMNSNPAGAAAAIGALAGARFGGIPGAVAGGIVGAAAGRRIAQSEADQSTDLAVRQRELARAKRGLASRIRLDAGLPRSGTITSSPSGLFTLRDASNERQFNSRAEAEAEVNRQRILLARSRIAAAKKRIGSPAGAMPLDASADVPKTFAGGGSRGGGGGGSAIADARRDRGLLRRADDLLARGQDAVSSGRADLSGDPQERLRIEQERIELARKARDSDLEEQALDNRFIAVNLTKLKALNAEAAAIDSQLAARRAAQETEQSAFERQRAAEDDAIAVIEVQARLAIVARDRFAIERRILKLKQQEEREALERVTRDTTGRFSSSDRQAAREALARLPARQAAEMAALANDQKGPLAQYRDRLIAATGDMNEALQNVAANGLQTLESGILGVIDGTESLGSAFKRMASSIIADLARIAIEKAIVGAIPGLGSFFGFADGGPVLRRAGGGPITGAGGGRDDRIPAMLSNGEYVINAASTARYRPLIEAINAGRLPRFAAGGIVSPSLPRSLAPGAGGGGQIVVMIALEDGLLNARIDNRAAGVAAQVVQATAPTIIDTAKTATVAALRRPGL